MHISQRDPGLLEAVELGAEAVLTLHVCALMLLGGSDVGVQWSQIPGQCKLYLMSIFKNSCVTKSPTSTLLCFSFYHLTKS